MGNNPKDHKHATLVKKIKEFYKKPDNPKVKIEFEHEVPYNNYGQRGYVDLVGKGYHKKTRKTKGTDLKDENFKDAFTDPVPTAQNWKPEKEITKWEVYSVRVCEMKTSIEKIDGTIRQYKKMKKNFKSTVEIDPKKIEARLFVLDNEENRKIINEYWGYFKETNLGLFDIENCTFTKQNIQSSN